MMNLRDRRLLATIADRDRTIEEQAEAIEELKRAHNVDRYIQRGKELKALEATVADLQKRLDEAERLAELEIARHNVDHCRCTNANGCTLSVIGLTAIRTALTTQPTTTEIEG